MKKVYMLLFIIIFAAFSSAYGMDGSSKSKGSHVITVYEGAGKASNRKDKKEESSSDGKSSLDVEGMEELGVVGGPAATKSEEEHIRALCGFSATVDKAVLKLAIKVMEKNNPEMLGKMRGVIHNAALQRAKSSPAVIQVIDEFKNALIVQLTHANDLKKQEMESAKRELEEAKKVGGFRFYLSMGVGILFSVVGAASGIAGLIMSAQKPMATEVNCMNTCLANNSTATDACVFECFGPK